MSLLEFEGVKLVLPKKLTIANQFSKVIRLMVSTVRRLRDYSSICLTPVYFESFRGKTSSDKAAPLAEDVSSKWGIATEFGLVKPQVIDFP